MACTCSQCPGRLTHADLQRKLRTSLFCLVPAGDTASSNRLTEVVLAGCIPGEGVCVYGAGEVIERLPRSAPRHTDPPTLSNPPCGPAAAVFVGPPWHSLPLPDQVDYLSMSLFYRVADTDRWILPDE